MDKDVIYFPIIWDAKGNIINTYVAEENYLIQEWECIAIEWDAV